MKKLKEHYGIEVCANMARKITEAHGQELSYWDCGKIEEPADQLIGEMDGSMIPIVEMGSKTEGSKDLRKTRKVCWKEAKLCFTRNSKKTNRTYAAIIGTADEAGANLSKCAKKTGLVEDTKIHFVSDGAQWIIDRVEEQFGPQAYFLIDFFHLCEYLAEAALWCNALNPKDWLTKAKKRLKEGQTQEVFQELESRLLALEKLSDDHALVKCVRYMKKRLKNMNYRQALEADLPIGSGEIESANRHVIQKRLKIAGAWWKLENANKMLNLRTSRLNDDWDSYWEHLQAAA